MNQTNDAPLTHQIITQLGLCGHFLHYRMGGRMGRRRILTALSEHQELLQRELQDILEVQSGSLSEMIIKMEAEGLVEKVRSQKDGRQLVVKLTAKGIEQSKCSKEEYDRQVARMMSCFSEEQLRELYYFLDTMGTHWKKVEKDIDFPMQENVKILNITKNQNNE